MMGFLTIPADAVVAPDPVISVGMLLFVLLPLLTGILGGAVVLTVILIKKRKRSENRIDGYSGESYTASSTDALHRGRDTDQRS